MLIPILVLPVSYIVCFGVLRIGIRRTTLTARFLLILRFAVQAPQLSYRLFRFLAPLSFQMPIYVTLAPVDFASRTTGV